MGERYNCTFPPYLLYKKTTHKYMIFKIKDKELTLKNSLRNYLIFESITERSFVGNSLEDIILLFFSSTLAQVKDKITLTYDEFLDTLDEQPNLITEYIKWLTEVNTNNNEITKHTEKEVKKKGRKQR